jgi:Flp pilus assembly protein TadG
LGPTKWSTWLRSRRDEEAGAELIEFALVVVLLVTLLYGIVFFGLTLGAKVTITQASADGARSSIVAPSVALAVSDAQNQALSDLGWMAGSLTCGTTVLCQSSASVSCPSSAIACVNAYEVTSTSTCSATCLIVALTYNYANQPIIPGAPGLGIITPKTISSVSTLQVSSTS